MLYLSVKMIHKLLVILIIFTLCKCEDDIIRKNRSIARQKLFEKGDFFQGDMRFQGTRNSITSKYQRWPYGVIPYQISPKFTPGEKSLIEYAMYGIYYQTGVKFVDKFTASYIPDQNHYIYIDAMETGCWSYVGRKRGGQVLNLQRSYATGETCLDTGTIQHELLHSLGFHHQHSVPNRDDFIEIRWENVQPEMRYAFELEHDTWNGCLPYDYLSIMHYNEYAFSKNGQPTIISKNAHVYGKLGQEVLSASDILKIKRMYGSEITRRTGAGRSTRIGTSRKYDLMFVLTYIFKFYF